MEKVNIKEVVNSARYFGQAKLKELNEKYSLGYLVSYDPGDNSCSWMADWKLITVHWRVNNFETPQNSYPSHLEN